MNLDDLLAPLPRAEFFARHWETAPLVLRRNDPKRYRDLLAAADLDHIIASACAWRSTQVELLRDGAVQQVRPDERPRTIYGAYRGGHSIRVRGVQGLWPALGRLCRNLQQELGFPVRANLYCTPARAAGTHRHFDCHDVFVVQVAGRKHWRLSDAPPNLPLQYVPGLPFERNETAFSLRADGPPQDVHAAAAGGETEREVVLEPGDLLYLPRGVAHTVWTGDEDSAHVTIGVYVLTWLDLLAVALGQAANRDVRFRRALPVAFTAQPASAGELREPFEALIRAFAGSADLGKALDEIAGSFVEGMQAFGDGALMEPAGASALGADTEVEWRPGTVFRLTALNGCVGLSSGVERVTVPEMLGEPVRFIARHRRFRIADLPGGMSARSKVSLVRQLVEKKLLRVV